MLFVPADSGRFVENAASRGADALILDLEDGVAAAAKAVARANLATFVPKLRAAGVPVYVRVNPDAALRLTDLEASIAADADGVLAPKIECADDVLVFEAEMGRFEARLGKPAGSTALIALVESPRALGNITAIAQVFVGSADEAERARRLLEVFDAAAAQGRGAVAHEGRMVDQPVALRARKFLQRHDALQRARERVREAAP